MAGCDRLELVANWGTLDAVRRFARIWQAWPDAHITRLHKALSLVQVEQTTMPSDLFGCVVGLGKGSETRWRVEINERLPLAASYATLGHEFGHTFQRAGLGFARCAPRASLTAVEQEAHAHGAILTVPLEAVEYLPLGDVVAARRVAVELTLPTSYIRIRAALAVFMDERRGSKDEASRYLNGAMLDHQLWMAHVSEYMTALGG